jgi:hypothetical protein
MPTSLPAPAILADFARRGFAFRAVADRLRISPASALTTADREVIRERRTELLAILTPAATWNQEEAIRLMHEADSLVEQLGVSGRHPAVADAAAMVVSAFATRDMETVRFAVSEFAVVVRRVASERKSTGVTKQTPTD